MTLPVYVSWQSDETINSIPKSSSLCVKWESACVFAPRLSSHAWNWLCVMVRIYLTPSENAVREQNNADFLLLVTLNQTSIGRCARLRVWLSNAMSMLQSSDESATAERPRQQSLIFSGKMRLGTPKKRVKSKKLFIWGQRKVARAWHAIARAASINRLLRDEFLEYRAHLFRKDASRHP